MRDGDAAIGWSSYDNHVSEVEYRTRHKIAEVIQQKIDDARRVGISNHFVSGLEVAKVVVLGFDPAEVDNSSQPELF